MAKNEPNKPDNKKSTPADKKQAKAKAAPDKPLEAEKAPDNVVTLDTSKQEAPEKPVDKTAAALKSDAPGKADSAVNDEKLKQGQEALLKAPPEKSADSEKKNPPAKKKADEKIKPFPIDKKPEEKKQREARSPKGPKEVAPPPETEKPPEPKEAPRPGEKEEIVFLKLSDLFPFKDHPFQVRDDDEMRAMAESIKDSHPGEGLLFYGSTTIPFVDRFPPGEIYNLLTTRPEDLKEARNE